MYVCVYVCMCVYMSEYLRISLLGISLYQMRLHLEN